MGCLQHPRLKRDLGAPVAQMKEKRRAVGDFAGSKTSIPCASSFPSCGNHKCQGWVGVGRSRGVHVRLRTEAPPCGRREKPAVYGAL